MRATMVLLVSLLVFATPAFAEKIYVSPNGGGIADGSKNNPTDLQSALDIAAANGKDDTLELLSGTYLAPRDGFRYGRTGHDGKRVYIRGGNAPSYWFSDRSEDPGDTILDGRGEERVFDVRSDIAESTIDITFNTLTIRNGHIDGHEEADDIGAGIRAWRENGGILRLELLDCDFRDNEAAGDGHGGGLATNCWVFLSGVNFVANRARVGAGLYLVRAAGEDASVSRYIGGGTYEGNRLSDGAGAEGIAVYSDVSPHFYHCEFKGDAGGASLGAGSPVFFTGGGAPRVRECRFTGITVDGSGSAITFENSGGEVTNCLFADNRAAGSGAIAIRFDAGVTQVPLTVMNSTFAGNRSGAPGYGGAIDTRSHGTVVTNSIFWDNGLRPIHQSEGGQNPSIDHSLVQGGLTDTGFADGGGNVLDPQVSPFRGTGSFHLADTSVCVDAGIDDALYVPRYDVEGNGRPYDGDLDGTAGVDMGAFELAPNLVTETLYRKSFGDVEIGKSVTSTVLIRNEGMVDLHVETVEIAGFEEDDFRLTEPFVPNQTVAPGENLYVEIEFTPSGIGPSISFLIVNSDDPDFRSPIDLRGEGIPFIHLSPTEGTIGTELSFLGGPFGSKKGKVWLEFTGRGGRTKKRPLKVLEWRDDLVRAAVTSRVSGSLEFRVMIQVSHSGTAPVRQGTFQVRYPESLTLASSEGAPGDEVTMNGLWFGDRKAKQRLYFEYEDSKGRTRQKRLKIVRNSLGWEPRGGQSLLVFVVPKLAPVSGQIVIMNRVGGGATPMGAFTIR
jgi:hypothetical protein